MDYEFEDQELQAEYINYIRERNRQIAVFKNNGGMSWNDIAERVGLSKDYVKSISHKLGSYGDTRAFDWKYPTR